MAAMSRPGPAISVGPLVDSVNSALDAGEMTVM